MAVRSLKPKRSEAGRAMRRQKPVNTGRRSRHALYGAKWRRAREAFLIKHPLCLPCLVLSGVEHASEVVDHLYPHKGDKVIFWNSLYWVPCCKTWHDGDKQSIERRGLVSLNALCLALGKPLPSFVLGDASPVLL